MAEKIQRKTRLRYEKDNHPSYANTCFVNQVEDNVFILDFAFADPQELHSIADDTDLTAHRVARLVMSKQTLLALAAEIREEI